MMWYKKSDYVYDASHPRVVSQVTEVLAREFSYGANGSMTGRVIGADTYTLLYDGALRLTEVAKNGASVATFRYDGDGLRSTPAAEQREQMVEAVIGGVTTYYVGGYFEWQTGGVLSACTKYYGAGRARASESRKIVIRCAAGSATA